MTDAEAETLILWQPDAKNWLTGKDPDAATWCKELTDWKRPWCWERSKAGGEGDDRGWDGWTASPTQWTWVWASAGSWWWTGRPGMLQSMGSLRVGHDWVTELNWTTKDQEQFKTCPTPRDVQAASACECEWNKASQAATFSNKTSRSCEGYKLPLEAKPVSDISLQRKKTLFYFLHIQGNLLFHEWPRSWVNTLCLEIKFYWDTALPIYVWMFKPALHLQCTAGPEKLKTVSVWPFTVQVCWPLSYTLTALTTTASMYPFIGAQIYLFLASCTFLTASFLRGVPDY